MLTLVAAVLAYERALDSVERLSSPPPLRSRYVRSETSEEKDMLLVQGRSVFFFGKSGIGEGQSEIEE